MTGAWEAARIKRYCDALEKRMRLFAPQKTQRHQEKNGTLVDFLVIRLDQKKKKPCRGKGSAGPVREETPDVFGKMILSQEIRNCQRTGQSHLKSTPKCKGW